MEAGRIGLTAAIPVPVISSGHHDRRGKQRGLKCG